MIRPMRPDDVPACLGVVADCWGRELAQGAQPDFSEMFSASAWRPFFYVAEIDGKVVGTAGHKVSWLSIGFHELFWVGVRGAQRGAGLGRQLVERCLEDVAPLADAVMLMTAIPDFYTRWGFKEIATLRTMPGLGDRLMVRPTPPEPKHPHGDDKPEGRV